MSRPGVLVVCVLAGCGDPSQPKTIDVVVKLDQPSLIYVTSGSDVTFNATITNPDGSPAPESGYTWNWTPPGATAADYNFTFTTRHLGPGREQLTAHFIERGMQLVNGYATTQGTQQSVVQAGSQVRVWGGPPGNVDTIQRHLDLLVGEARPVLGLVLSDLVANAPPNLQVVSDVAPAFVSMDPGIVSVDADGLVTGLAAGTATLQVSAGGQFAKSISVTVTAGAPAPPAAPSVLRLDGLDLAAAATTLPVARIDGSPENRMALDSKGYPAFVITAFSEIVLARWTGSGYGLEWVGELHDSSSNARVTIDARDHIYVVYRTKFDPRWVVADRALSGTPGVWHRSTLTSLSSEAIADGVNEARIVNSGSFPSAATIQPHAGGGAWVAWFDGNDFSGGGVGDTFHAQARCLDLVRLAEVSDGGVAQQDVSLVWFDVVEVTDHCHQGEFHLDASLLVQLLANPTGTPDVLSAYPSQSDFSVRRFALAGGAWTKTTEFSQVHFLSVARSAHAPDAILGINSVAAVHGGDVPADATIGLAAAGTTVFSIATQAGLILESDAPASASRVDRFGSPAYPDPSPLWPATYTFNGGYANDDAAIYRLGVMTLVDGQTLAMFTERAPPPTRMPSDPEAGGRRLDPAKITSHLNALVSFDDGARRFSAEGLPEIDPVGLASGLYGMAAHDAPVAPISTSTGEYFTQLTRVGGTLYRPDQTPIQFSTDRGATWTTAPMAALPQDQPTGTITADGAVWNLVPEGAGGFHPRRWPSAQTAAPPVALTTSVAGFNAAYTANTTAILDDADGGVTILVSGNWYDATGTNHVGVHLIRRYTGTTLVDDELVMPLPSQANNAGALRAADGAVLLTASGGIYRIPAGTATATFIATGPTPTSAGTLTRLHDGRLALTSIATIAGAHLAVVQSSSDGGRTWSAPVQVFPGVGRNQTIKQAVAEADGGLLVAMRDNGVPSPTDAPLIDMFVRISTP